MRDIVASYASYSKGFGRQCSVSNLIWSWPQ